MQNVFEILKPHKHLRYAVVVEKGQRKALYDGPIVKYRQKRKRGDQAQIGKTVFYKGFSHADERMIDPFLHGAINGQPRIDEKEKRDGKRDGKNPRF